MWEHRRGDIRYTKYHENFGYTVEQMCGIQRYGRQKEEILDPRFWSVGCLELPGEENAELRDCYKDHGDYDEIGQGNRERSMILPYRYDGTGCWETYRTHFETVATVNGWTTEEKAWYLVASLDGDALSVLRELKGKGGLYAYGRLVRLMEQVFGSLKVPGRNSTGILNGGISTAAWSRVEWTDDTPRKPQRGKGSHVTAQWIAEDCTEKVAVETAKIPLDYKGFICRGAMNDTGPVLQSKPKGTSCTSGDDAVIQTMKHDGGNAKTEVQSAEPLSGHDATEVTVAERESCTGEAASNSSDLEALSAAMMTVLTRLKDKMCNSPKVWNLENETEVASVLPEEMNTTPDYADLQEENAAVNATKTKGRSTPYWAAKRGTKRAGCEMSAQRDDERTDTFKMTKKRRRTVGIKNHRKTSLAKEERRRWKSARSYSQPDVKRHSLQNDEGDSKAKYNQRQQNGFSYFGKNPSCNLQPDEMVSRRLKMHYRAVHNEWDWKPLYIPATRLEISETVGVENKNNISEDQRERDEVLHHSSR